MKQRPLFAGDAKRFGKFPSGQEDAGGENTHAEEQCGVVDPEQQPGNGGGDK